MNDPNPELGQIDSVNLGFEGHGILSFMLNLKFGSHSQGFGGYQLDEPLKINGQYKGRHGTVFGTEVILRILNSVGVEAWEDLLGKEVWAWRDEGRMIVAIEAPAYREHEGRFNIKDLAKEYYPEGNGKERKQE